MKRLLVLTLLAAACPFAFAEDGVIELWECTINDGKTPEEVRAANAAWLKFQNSTIANAGIRSWALTSVVGNSAKFTFMDRFPSLDVWAKAKASLKTPEGQAAEAAILATATCTRNRLYEATEH